MQIEHIAVIGAGQMGTGIAQVAAAAGFQVQLLDVDEKLAVRAKERIDGALAGQVKKGKLEDKVRIETVADARGDRPWAPKPRATEPPPDWGDDDDRPTRKPRRHR